MSSKKSSQTNSSLIPSESTLLKWLPLVAAGGALGVSFYMLKEVQKIKKENTKNDSTIPKEYVQQIEAMDQQLRKVSGFLAQQFPPESTKIQTKKESSKPDNDYEEVEVEEVEVEVTDDETEEEEGEEEVVEDGKDEISLK